MNITFSKLGMPKSGTLVTWVAEGGGLSATAKAVDSASAGAIGRAIGADPFKGKAGQVLSIMTPQGTKLDRVVLIGIGKENAFDATKAESLGGTIAAYCRNIPKGTVTVAMDAMSGSKLASPDAAALVGNGAYLRNYSFDKYHTKKTPDQKPSLKRLAIMSTSAARAKASFQPLKGVSDGVYLTRDLVSEPANILFPAELAKRARSLTQDGVKVEVLGEARMRKLGMGSLLGVGMGSQHESQLVVMQWNGAPKGANQKPIAFIGKGVTFDTGGISIKPSGGMEDMKWDMGGSGVVIGLMRALAKRKAKVNVVGVVGLVENMPSGTAQRPGDIVTSMSGQTIEVLNTDAEGRLVLADALWYTQDRFAPRMMVDLATLTGAIIVSLGHERAGLFCNDETLQKRLVAAGDTVGEKVWPMPLDDAYDKDIDSPIADMKNIGSGRGAGSVTAAKFLERFVKNTPWAHLDIAGVTWSKKDSPVVPKGGTAFGVRLLDRLVSNNYEK